MADHRNSGSVGGVGVGGVGSVGSVGYLLHISNCGASYKSYFPNVHLYLIYSIEIIIHWVSINLL